MEKIKLLKRDKWYKEIKSMFLSYVDGHCRVNRKAKKLLTEILDAYLEEVENVIGSMDRWVYMEAVCKTSQVRVISTRDGKGNIGIKHRNITKKYPQFGYSPNKGIYIFKDKVTEVSDALGSEVTVDQVVSWLSSTMYHVGKSLSKEVLGIYYMEDMYLKFGYSGRTFDDFLDYIQDLNKKYGGFSNQYLNRVFLKPVVADIRRASGNDRKKSFDFIEMEVPIIDSVGKDEAKKIIKENMRVFVDDCAEVLKENTKYKKFGVPTNFLKVGKITITRDNLVIITFELKDIEPDLKETHLFS